MMMREQKVAHIVLRTLEVQRKVMTASNEDMKEQKCCSFSSFSVAFIIFHQHTFCDKIEKHLKQQDEDKRLSYMREKVQRKVFLVKNDILLQGMKLFSDI